MNQSMSNDLPIESRCAGPLDAGWVPAVLWNRVFRRRVAESGGARAFGVALERPDGSVSVYETELLPGGSERDDALNLRYVERIVKFLLWQKGGFRVCLGGDERIARAVAAAYSSGGERAFDYDFMGEKVYRRPFEVVSVGLDELPAARESEMSLGGNLEGCRSGFDLGGSDRKCAAVIDGEVVFSEEIPWDPYFESDPRYHYDGIQDSLERAAAHLPRIDAIGGSAAGIYVENEVRVASLFRGVPDDVFENRVRRIFFELREKWGGVPFDVINDGEVTALAGSLATGDTGVLGVAMGTSEAAGYVNPAGRITNWINELAFTPIDYRPDAPVDEWSGDVGCGVQYLSQQGVGRLAVEAGIGFPDGMGLPEKLVEVQKLADKGDPVAEKVFATVGRCFGYAVAHYADFYQINQVLVLGRVTSGAGGELLLREAKGVMKKEFPELAEKIGFRTPGEKEKRHGQAIAAASLPALDGQ